MQIAKKVLSKGLTKPMNVILIDMEGVGAELDELKDDNLTFRIYTYSNLRYEKPDYFWDKTFKSVNEFLSTLSQEEQLALGMMFSKIKLLCDDMRTDRLVDTIDIMSTISSDVFSKYGLSKKMISFVRNSNLHVPALKNAGSEDYHTKADTFMRDDFYLTMTVAMLCKLFCPVFGEIIYTTRKDVDSYLKEIKCVSVLKHILDSDFSYITDKIQLYLDNRCQSQTNDSSYTNSFSGYTNHKFGFYTYATTLVKKFVNIDLRDPECDIITYMYACAKGTISNLHKNMRNKNMVRPRMDPNTDIVDGNDSKLETEATISSKTADTQAVVSYAIDSVIEDNLILHDLDLDEFEKILTYYENNPSTVTNLNSLLAMVTIGNEIGGSRGINMITAKYYNKVVAYLQMYLVFIGMGELAHAVSMVPVNQIKSELTPVDVRIDQNRGASHSFKVCAKKYPYQIGKRTWRNVIDSICDDFIGTNFVYNSPKYVWDALNEEPRNGQLVSYDDSIIRDVMDYIVHTI